jgi:hypothetical protein
VNILISILMAGYIYGPVKDFTRAAFAIKWIFFPAIVLSGLWLWKWHLVCKWFHKRSTYSAVESVYTVADVNTSNMIYK